MPANKYAAIRYRVIDQMIGNKYQPYPTKEDLRQACEEAIYGSTSGDHISDSTLEKDLQYMKLEYDAPIKFSRSHGGYYYAEEGYSIDLNSEQVEAIKMAANVLSQFRNTEVFAEFHSAIDKILDRVNISPDIQDQAIQEYVQFETAPVVLGTEFLGPLLEAIKSKNTVDIEYKKFQSESSSERRINPYLLKEYQNRWYVIGYDTNDGFVKTYSLDRIHKVELTAKRFEVDKAFNVDRFFQHNVGITTIDKDPEKVVLSVTPLEGMYLKSQPLHWTQQVLEDNDKECQLRIEVVVTKELVMKLLSFGSGVKIISPNNLRELVKKELQSSINNYE